MSLVLIADSAGTPKDWVNFEAAVCYYAKDKVLWEAGSAIREFLGGHNYLGEQSKITISSILCVSGPILGSAFYDKELANHPNFKIPYQTAMFCILVTVTFVLTAAISFNLKN